MQLWNDYENKTIAETYTLGQLLRPEGRSAFFEMTDGPGAPAVIRITESLNDEQEMLERWRTVSALKQQNLLEIKDFGQTVFEGTPLTYAVVEASDAALADILSERALTVEETRQIAESLVAGLTALHAAGLVHKHIDATNVTAVGETVKLRTDCVSECVPDPELTTPAECQELIAKDVHDLSLLLLRAITLEKKIVPGIKLQAPFDKIVAHGIDGSWGLERIASALNPPVIKPLVPESVLNSNQVESISRAPVQSDLQFVTKVKEEAPSRVHKPIVLPRRVLGHPVDSTRSYRWWAGCAAVVLVAFLLYFHFAGSKTVTTAQVTPAIPSSSDVPAPPAQPSGLTPREPKAFANERVPPPVSHIQAGWYVIAYTYNREDQAWKKVAAIIRQHASLKPLVIAPNGRGPFMIAFGGAMSRGEAEAVRDRARRAGMPRDTFVRNYPG